MPDSRATTLEFLDQHDCDPALAAASYKFMEIVNFHFGGIRTVRRFLAAETSRHPRDTPFRLLDIGSGSCDIPLAMSRWANIHGIPLHITCLEPSPHAIAIARKQIAQAGGPALQLLQEDVFTHQPAEPYDGAIASMCFHHFSDAQILALLRKLPSFVHGSVLINDLRRSRMATQIARLLLSVTGASAGLRHDALLSIQRGFKINEILTLLQQLDNVTVSAEPVRWFRIAAILRFHTQRV